MRRVRLSLLLVVLGIVGLGIGKAASLAQESSPGAGCPTTTEDANITIVTRFYEEVENQGHLEVMDDLFAPTYVHHSAVGADLDSVEARKERITRGRAAFPDFRIATDLVLADGDYVTVRWTLRGTHLGEFRGVPPSGASVTYTGISIFRIECGRVVETWDEADLYGLLQQIGGLPAPAESPATPVA